MGYAEIYRKRMSKGRRTARVGIWLVVLGTLLYFSLQIIFSQSGLMVGGTIGGGPQQQEGEVSTSK
jgi:hypothetical protein